MRSYGTLTVSSPAFAPTEPLLLAEVVTFLGLPVRDPEDEAEQAMLSGFIAAAREQAELLQGRDLVAKQYDLALDGYPCSGEIELRTPLISVDLVRDRDSTGNYTTRTEGTHYIVDTARGLILPPYGESWPSFTPWPSSALLVRFTSGMTSSDAFWFHAGQRLKVGMRQLVSEYFNNRLPVSYALAAPGKNGDPTLDRIAALLSYGGILRCR